jgi:hypothetical protein
MEQALSAADMERLADLIDQAGGIDELLCYLEALAQTRAQEEPDASGEPDEQHRPARLAG